MEILVIGTSVIDLFLNVDRDHTHVTEKTVSFTLGDKVPTQIDKLAIGGNGANVAVGLARLALPSVLYTYFGDDILSQELRQSITQEGVELVASSGKQEYSPLHLIFNFEKDRIIFSDYKIKQYEFAYEKSPPNYVYLTSIGTHWENAYTQALTYMQTNQIPYAFSPGSRQLEDMGEIFTNALTHASILFINKEEAVHILEKLGKSADNMQNILLTLQSFGPKVVSVTDGAQGAYCADETKTVYHIKAFNNNKLIIQKTGAGDAYATGFFASYLLKNPLVECMRWGALNAHAVMEHLGAQEGLMTKKQIEEELKKYSNFRAEKI